MLEFLGHGVRWGRAASILLAQRPRSSRERSRRLPSAGLAFRVSLRNGAHLGRGAWAGCESGRIEDASGQIRK